MDHMKVEIVRQLLRNALIVSQQERLEPQLERDFQAMLGLMSEEEVEELPAKIVQLFKVEAAELQFDLPCPSLQQAVGFVDNRLYDLQFDELMDLGFTEDELEPDRFSAVGHIGR